MDNYKRANVRFQDFTGRQFGRLSVVRYIGNNAQNARLWECRCDCGNTHTATTTELTSGGKTMCDACAQEKRTWSKCKIEPGQRFGRLTVLGLDHKGDRGRKYWKCQCDCGGSAVVPQYTLLEGHTISCGCYRNECSRHNFKLYDGTSIQQITSPPTKANKTGVRGVSFCKEKEKYLAQLKIRGQYHFLGYYETIDEAAKARHEAEELYYAPVIDAYYAQNGGTHEPP